MKKVIAFMLVLANMLSMLACSAYIQDSNEYDPHKYNPQQEAIYNEETLKEILKCFDNKDADSLIDMFSEAVKSQYDLESQIEKAFEIYSGKSVSYGDIINGGYKYENTDHGICIEKSIYAYMENIKTDNNEVFTISIIQWVISDINTNELGLSKIFLCDENHIKLAVIGRVQSQELRILEENNRNRNNGMPSSVAN